MVRIHRLGHLQPEGGFNDGIEVWQEDTSQGRLLIRKAFRREDVPAHALREVRLLNQLSPCPYIVRMYSASITRTAGELFMECCGKGTIKALIREHGQRGRKIPEAFVWHVFISLVEAVHYMQHGPPGGGARAWNYVYHRDLHPGNIFITGRRDTGLHVVLGDFGSAVSRAWGDGARVHMQAVDFGIPESCMNDTSDIYQIGLVIIAMCRLTYRPLALVRPTRGARERLLAGPQYSDALNRLVERCLRTNPGDRVGVLDLRAELRREYYRASCHDRRELLVFPTMRIYQR
ncbi:kinase-like protein [Karstenula rhodostoma CBS 690.94]|uniref:non-specific serine/threonine protein kinase n=1 Tax=Karstenula rhodostoma CBS 690.94 TaxID=1392251 RepID=A0A9P4PQ60_9PLEO|nr:kinase-like protein [Karstenula rhodostoma CBS 690.94]